MQRVKCNVIDSEYMRSPDFSKQYFKTYCVRLSCLVEFLTGKIVEKWRDIAVKRLSDIEPEEKCVIMGTIYKKMNNKPSVIKELTDSHQLGIRPVPPHKLFSDDDKIILEDLQQRINLRLDEVVISTKSLVTGVVCAVKGYESESEKGTFIVEDIIFATPEFPIMRSISAEGNQPRFIALISGIRLNDYVHSNMIRVKLFFDWLSGFLPTNSLPVDPRTIGRLIIAGDSIDDNRDDKLAIQNKFLIKKSDVTNSSSMTRFDQLICDVCKSIQVDIMPGHLDPTSMLLPQKPMHRVLFPNSKKWSSFNPRPNPWQFYLDDGSLVIGTSGQTIDDIDRYADIDDPLDRLEATIKWGHIAPTAPDTLPSYPNNGLVDPFVMLHKPSLYFAGNQEKLSWRKFYDEDSTGMSTLLVSVPRFSETGEVVLVDLHNKNCQTLKFK